MSAAELDRELIATQPDPVEYAQALIDVGVPVVVCKPNPSYMVSDPETGKVDTGELLRPAGWAIITAEECDLSRFRPGIDTLAMVGGHGVDVVDVDTKDDGSVDNLPPFRFFGRHLTPSGGWHYLVRSTGIGKLSPLTTSAGHVGDYVGGTPGGGSRLLAYLPGSTRPKYPGAGYQVVEPVRLEELLEHDPDDDLVGALLAYGGSREGDPGRPAVGRAEVEAFLAEHTIEPDCHYGRAAVAGMLEDSESVIPGDVRKGRHGWAIKSAVRAVELVRGGCMWSRDLDVLEERLAAMKPEEDWHAAIAWGIANAKNETACGQHNPAGTEADDQDEDAADPEPVSLTVGQPSAPFPTEALPAVVGVMVEAAATALQVDIGATATSAITMIAAACGGRVHIELKPGWVEPTNLYTVTVADPGERKSSIQEVMTTGLVDAEQVLDAEGEEDRRRLAYEHDVAEKAFEKAKVAAGRANAGRDRDLALDEVKLEAERLAAIVVPAQPQIVFGDLTPEATAMALQDQNGRIAVVSAEGGLFGTLAGRYSGGQANVDVFTQGYSGEAVRVRRVGRDDVKVPKACITLALMVQPEVMREVGGNRALTGRGLVDRFLFCEPRSQVGARKSRSTPIPATVMAAFNKRTKELVLDLEKDLERHGRPVTLTLSTAAQERFYTVMDEMEKRLGREGECHEIRAWASKHSGRIGRIAGLIHMVTNTMTETVVTADTIAAAERIGTYYIGHALRAYSQMKLDVSTQDAVYLLAKLRDHLRRDDIVGSEFTERDALRLARKFHTRAELLPALERLEDHGFILPVEVVHDGAPAKRSPRYRAHSSLLEEPTDVDV